jgi:hypothetical protein
MTTGFNLVARLGPSGHAGGNGIYAIYDMFPRDEFADYDQYLDDDYDDYLASEEYVANGGQGFDHGPEHDKRLRQRQFKHSYWGIPPVAKGGNEKEQFSCAKLADRFSDLGRLIAWSGWTRLSTPSSWSVLCAPGTVACCGLRWTRSSAGEKGGARRRGED